MPRGIYPRNSPLCAKGHNKDITGRTKKGACKECAREKERENYVPHPRQLKQFCPKGHDTFVVGRDKGQCSQCHSESYTPVEVDKRFKQFCPKGHNKDITGKDDDGMCIICKVEYQKEYKQKYLKEIEEGKRIALPRKQFCIEGHDTFICGRNDRGYCISCDNEYYDKNKEELARKTREWEEKNLDKVLARRKVYWEENKEELSRINREWRNTHQKEIAEKRKQRILENPEKYRADKILRQTNRDLRVPSWADWDQINLFYHNKPESMTVDHIIPVLGDEVSGLHVSWNFQYLTGSDNSKKGNRIDLIWASEWYGKILEKEGLKQVIEYAKI